ncbi:PspA/IM30 family protein [Virgibacillus sediminis]|uniref:PspA/IM30 family protein n=1 Tax=Virgibacillus sediminis TaxID=202260 RepID=A0ABV7A6L6_9BACI
MFKFFRRLKTVLGSELNSMLDKAEDPVKMLDQFMRDMESDIHEAEGTVAKQMAHEKMLKRKANDAKVMAEKRHSQAAKAVEAGEDDLARRAIEDKLENEKQAEALLDSWQRAKADTDSLKDKLDEMKKEYREMQLKRDSLKTRADSARARAKMNRSLSSIGSDETKQGFERMEEKVIQYEAEADTTEDLTEGSRTLDEELEALEPNPVEKELASLKENSSADK